MFRPEQNKAKRIGFRMVLNYRKEKNKRERKRGRKRIRSAGAIHFVLCERLNKLHERRRKPTEHIKCKSVFYE